MKHVLYHACARAFTQTVAIVLGVSVVFTFFLEPVVSRSQTNDTFVVRQNVGGAIAFAQTANDVEMNGVLDGLTGGTAYGTTTTRVTTNNGSGFNLTIRFSSTTAMISEDDETNWIDNYLYSTGTASYPSGFDVTPANAQFGFTVNASNTGDVASVFTESGGLCGTSNNGTFTVNSCWRGASSTDETAVTTLINTTDPTPSSGVTSTVQFRVTIPNNPVPAVPSGWYRATATLTATDNA